MGAEKNNRYTHTKYQGRGFTNDYVAEYSRDQKRGDFSFDTIHGLPLKKMTYTVLSYEERQARRAEFDGYVDAKGRTREGMRSKFLKHLGREHAEELKKQLGFSDKAIKEMAKYGHAPKGYNVHHKLPLHGGGKNEFSNFILTPLCPHDQWHHDVMDPQILGIREGESRDILVPSSEEMIYDPKKYGFTKDNVKTEPNYDTVVFADAYSKNYTQEHVNAIRHRRMAAQQASKAQQNGPVNGPSRPSAPVQQDKKVSAVFEKGKRNGGRS